MSEINLDNLRITNHDLDELTGLDISELSMGWGTRLSVFRQPGLRWAWLINQGLVLAVALVLWLPVCLVLGRNLAAQAVGVFVGVGGAIATTVAHGIYGIHKGTQLKVLSHLLDEVDRFKEMMKAVEILDELRQADRSKRLSLDNPDEVKEALHLTRESLVCGLMSDKIMRKHQRFIARRHELFTSIETNLYSLQALQASDLAGDYGQLLNEALQVGTRVHQELRQSSR
ncbi:hypothetical protein IQ260_02385 [Leptolyngbya cf. ectocarpi LEGE 11479]|uniref:Uncharacterized protein n=1 Tax=Leptolyngbya cf. ectocarpi LEGE 11479 TaxID=1828722 RepID=A0A928X0A1_LEPEC|nr:hypothetical protein [Leptolyngbya ectocarpi]MBE9065496.1 hypothetical protein [Leptolyngbya cf. ectocarpi LEGE 11479]